MDVDLCSSLWAALAGPCYMLFAVLVALRLLLLPPAPMEFGEMWIVGHSSWGCRHMRQQSTARQESRSASTLLHCAGAPTLRRLKAPLIAQHRAAQQPGR